MKLKNRTNESKRSTASTVLYTSAIVVLLIAIASVVNTVRIYNETIAQYIAQGYKSAEVVKQLLPNQLLPGVFEAIAVYAGIAFLLFGMGLINNKLSQYLECSNQHHGEQLNMDDNAVTLDDAPIKASNENLASPIVNNSKPTKKRS